MLDCEYCGCKTNTLEPVVMNKCRNDQIKLFGVCSICGITKAKFLPRYILDQISVISRAHRDFKNNINYMNLYGHKIRLFPILNNGINDLSKPDVL